LDWPTSSDRTGCSATSGELVSAGALTADEALAMDDQVKDQIQQGIRFALDSPYPPVASALESVYA
jgi:TPP-dependent pyruvate/acetoin dehydrogenase alpha subunit